MEKFLHQNETEKIIGMCYRIHNVLGSGHKEGIYQKSLVEELKKEGYAIEQEKRIPIFYEGKNVGTYIPDLVVNGNILIELKAKPYTTTEDEKQFWSYLKGTSYKLGLLVNFGKSKVDIRRRVYDSARLKIPSDSQFKSGANLAHDISRSSRGFTLIELLLVVGILAVVFGLALPFALNTKFTNELDTATENLITTLREAQSQAIAAEGDTPYGVYFDSSSSPQKYTIYKGASWLSKDDSFNV